MKKLQEVNISANCAKSAYVRPAKVFNCMRYSKLLISPCCHLLVIDIARMPPFNETSVE